MSDSSCGETDITAQEFDSEIETVPPQPAATTATPPAPVHEPGYLYIMHIYCINWTCLEISAWISAPVISSEPKTYANLVKSGQPSGYNYMQNQVLSKENKMVIFN